MVLRVDGGTPSTARETRAIPFFQLHGSGLSLHPKPILAALEHFHKRCSDVVIGPIDGGLFGFWLRFGSVTGFCKPAPSPKPRQKPKILAAHRYIFSVNALGLAG